MRVGWGDPPQSMKKGTIPSPTSVVELVKCQDNKTPSGRLRLPASARPSEMPLASAWAWMLSTFVVFAAHVTNLDLVSVSSPNARGDAGVG